MEIDFLQAHDNTPLTKQFTQTPQGIETDPFPFTRDFVSHREEIHTIEGFHEAVARHASKNHCLLKGTLDRELDNESRAGHTDAYEPTSWMLLDLDFDSGWENIDAFIADLNPEWKDVSYIWQHSSSAGIKYTPGLRGHLWLLLNEPITPETLKLWLRERNLQLGKLANHLSLTANGMGLRWGLDITTCQNDKLIYIAPPMLVGLNDPLDERIKLTKKKQATAPAPRCNLTPAAIETQTQEIIQRLRNEAGLQRRTARFTDYRDTPLLTNPDEARVTGVKKGRDFVYLNLNDGDSWGYYFPENNPDILYNFKGEPLVRLRAIAPGFHAEYRRERTRATFGRFTPYVFRDASTDTYYNAIYQNDEARLALLSPVSSKERMADFMGQYGHGMPDPVEDWDIEFDPTTTDVLNEDKKWINRFRPSEYLIRGPGLTAYPAVPDVIGKVLTSITAGDDEVKEHFLNWLACLIQTRERLETAWIFHGIQGTGKGVLLNKILKPILGHSHVTEWTTKDFEDNFNSPLETTSLLWLDEFKASSARDTDALMSRLKNTITEPTLSVRAMRTAAVQRRNFVNVIIASNFPDPIHLSENDRRFNVSPPQERKLLITPKEVADLADELWLFTSYLLNRKADLELARNILDNNARDEMIGASQPSQEAFFSAIRNGNLDYFLDHMRKDLPSDNAIGYQHFETTLRNWANRYLDDPASDVLITRDELRDAMAYITGMGSTPGKFSRMCAMYRVPMRRCRHGDDLVQGTRVTLRTHDPETLRALLAKMQRSHLQLVKGDT